MAIINSDAIQIPVINISDPTAALGDALIDAASNYGFIYIESKGSGFTEEDVNRAFEMVRSEALIMVDGGLTSTSQKNSSIHPRKRRPSASLGKTLVTTT